MSDKTGGPAFPSHGSMGEVVQEGMTLRDYFAAKAMQGMIAGITKFRDDMPDIIVNRPNDISELAYKYADAMIEKMEK